MGTLHSISLFTVLLLVATSLHASNFPLREMFPKVAPIELETLHIKDAGIFDWARSYPDDAVLLGQSPVDPARLISREKLAQHMLEPEAFAQRVSNNSIVLDIRDNSQKDAINLFPMQQRSVALDNNRLAAFVRQAKQEDKTLLIYDAVGRQVAWLQYYLEAEQVPSYFFMRGGAEAFIKF